MSDVKVVTAAMLVIGDEILSGRTKDKNIGFVADYLTGLGIDLKEVRIVADEEADIVEAVNSLRTRYTYIFTSGGIGPTHDDITADSVSVAFGVPCIQHPEAVAILEEHYASTNLELTKSRMRMTRTPQGADLIHNSVSKAPGFRIENVHVMAGVPKIMQAMMDSIAPTLESGTKMLSRTIDCPFGEGAISGPLGEIQDNHSDTLIGSYPRYESGKYSTQIVVRGRSADLVDAAAVAINNMLDGI